MSRLYGETISKDVVKQLNLRAEILGEQGLRNSNSIRYINQKTAWIRVISSVDRYEKEEASFTNKSAKNLQSIFMVIFGSPEMTLTSNRILPRVNRLKSRVNPCPVFKYRPA